MIILKLGGTNLSKISVIEWQPMAAWTIFFSFDYLPFFGILKMW